MDSLDFSNDIKTLKDLAKKFNADSTTVFERYAVLQAVRELGLELENLCETHSGLYKKAMLRNIGTV